MWGPGLALKATKMAYQMVTQMAVGLINIHFSRAKKIIEEATTLFSCKNQNKLLE